VLRSLVPSVDSHSFNSPNTCSSQKSHVLAAAQRRCYRRRAHKLKARREGLRFPKHEANGPYSQSYEGAEFERRLPPAPTSRVVMLRRPSRREMRAALKSLATATSLSLDRQSLRELSVWCDGDVRRAVGAIQQLKFEAERRAAGI
jgi:hypothetical protein